MKPNKLSEMVLSYFREVLVLLALTGSIWLGYINPETYHETTRLVLISTVSGFFGISNSLKQDNDNTNYTRKKRKNQEYE